MRGSVQQQPSLPRSRSCLLKKTAFLQCPVVVAQLFSHFHAGFLESGNERELGAIYIQLGIKSFACKK